MFIIIGEMKKGLVKFFILSKIKMKLIFLFIFFFFVPDIVRLFPTWIYFDRGEHYNIIETPTTTTNGLAMRVKLGSIFSLFDV